MEQWITSYGLRQLCIKNNWFTHGTNEQYMRMFDMLDDGASLDEIALIISFCSESVTRDEVKETIFEHLSDYHRKLVLAKKGEGDERLQRF